MCTYGPCWRNASSCGHRTRQSRLLGCGDSPMKTGSDTSRVEIASSDHATGLESVPQELCGSVCIKRDNTVSSGVLPVNSTPLSIDAMAHLLPKMHL